MLALDPAVFHRKAHSEVVKNDRNENLDVRRFDRDGPCRRQVHIYYDRAIRQ